MYFHPKVQGDIKPEKDAILQTHMLGVRGGHAHTPPLPTGNRLKLEGKKRISRQFV